MQLHISKFPVKPEQALGEIMAETVRDPWENQIVLAAGERMTITTLTLCNQLWIDVVYINRLCTPNSILEVKK